MELGASLPMRERWITPAEQQEGREITPSLRTTGLSHCPSDLLCWYSFLAVLARMSAIHLGKLSSVTMVHTSCRGTSILGSLWPVYNILLSHDTNAIPPSERSAIWPGIPNSKLCASLLGRNFNFTRHEVSAQPSLYPTYAMQ